MTPNEVIQSMSCSFVHKRIVGALKGFVTGGPTGAVAGALTSGGGGGSRPRRPLVHPHVSPAHRALHASGLGGHPFSDHADPGFMHAGNCAEGSVMILGQCRDIEPGGAVSGGGLTLDFGEAVMGRYGVALVPGSMAIDRARCPRGTVLGNDGLCYNKIANKDRMWPRGRKPLLTGGELNAITTAKKAANKVGTQVERLVALGMLQKKAPARRRKAKPKQLPANITVVDT